MDLSDKNAAQIVSLALKGATQKDFVTEFGKSQSMISKYKTGKADPPSEVIIHCVNMIMKREQQATQLTEIQIDDLIVKVREVLSPESRSASRQVMMSFLEEIEDSN